MIDWLEMRRLGMGEYELLHKKNQFFVKISWVCLLFAIIITWLFTYDFQYISSLIYVGVPLATILSILVYKKWAIELTMYLTVLILVTMSFFLILSDPHITSYFVIFFVLVIVRLYERYSPVIFTSILLSFLSLIVYIYFQDSVFESFRGPFDLVFALIYIWIITFMNLGHIRFTTNLQKEIDTIQKEVLEEKMKVEKLHSLGGLVAGVAHEINTPLGISLTGASHIFDKTNHLQSLYQENKMKRKDIENYFSQVEETTSLIERNLERASKLITSFKEVSVDQSVDEARLFKVKHYIEETILALSSNLNKSNVEVKVNGDPSLEMKADPNLLFQIISNLVMNSIIHAYPVDRDQVILISVEKNKENLTIQYADNGKGMPISVGEKIFEPFFTTNRNNGGSGLGMHIVHNLVTMGLHGSIVCDSKEGTGTKFIMSIPNVI